MKQWQQEIICVIQHKRYKNMNIVILSWPIQKTTERLMNVTKCTEWKNTLKGTKMSHTSDEVINLLLPLQNDKLLPYNNN